MGFSLDRFRVFILRDASLEEAERFAEELGITGENVYLFPKVRIDDVRRIKEDVSVNREVRCVYILGEIGVESQSAMLKMLEEPPNNVYFVFAGSKNLLDTVISRAQVIRRGIQEEGSTLGGKSVSRYLLGVLEEWKGLDRKRISDSLRKLSLSLVEDGRFEEAKVLVREANLIENINLNRRLFLCRLVVKLSRLEKGAS